MIEKRSDYLMFMLGLNESIDQLRMAMAVFVGMVMCYVGHVLRSVLDLEVEGRRKKWWLKRTWKRQFE